MILSYILIMEKLFKSVLNTILSKSSNEFTIHVGLKKIIN